MHPLVYSPWRDISVIDKKYIFLDLDDTLYDYSSCHNPAIDACEILANEKYQIGNRQFRDTWKTSRDSVHADLQGHGASHSRLLYAHKLHEHLFASSNPDFALDMDKTYWSTFIRLMKLYEEAEKFMAAAKVAGVKICIVTDLTTEIQMRKWLKLDLGRYASYLVTSEEAGVEKPDPKIFHLALNKFNAEPSEVIMVGDNYEKDIRGAESLGIKSYLVAGSETK